MKKQFFTTVMAIIFATAFMFTGCKDSDDDSDSGSTVSGTITLPSSVTSQEYYVGLDTDQDGSNGTTKNAQGTVTGGSFTYSLTDVPSGSYYLYAEVNVSGGQLGPWEAGDYTGSACDSSYADSSCLIAISSSKTIDFTLKVE